MLVATVTLWALNFTVTKYVISHGFHPIAYSSFRFGGAALIFLGITWFRERSFAIERRDLAFLASAALIGIFLNQLAFSYAIKLTTATTVALLFGTLPVLTGIFAYALGIERFGSRFWLAAMLAFLGAALVAVGSGGGLSGQLWGDLLGLLASATWAWYTVAISPLLKRYSTLRISSLAFVIGTVPLLIVGSQQIVVAGLQLRRPDLALARLLGVSARWCWRTCSGSARSAESGPRAPRSSPTCSRSWRRSSRF